MQNYRVADRLRGPIKRHGPILVLFAVLVGLLHYPLLMHLGSRVIGRPFDDVFAVLWQYEWMRRAVFDLGTNPFFTADVFYPHGYHVASGPDPSWYILALAPLTALIGAVRTYNLVMLGTLIFGGFGVYLLVHDLLRQRLPGVIAGLIYIGAPVLTIRLGGHQNILLGAMGLPYTIWALRRALLAPKGGERPWIILGGLLWALTILSSWYFLFIATLPLVGLLFVPGHEGSFWGRFKRLAAAGVVCLVGLIPFALLTWQANQATLGGLSRYSLAASDNFSLSPDRLFLPGLGHPLWGEAVRDWYRQTVSEADWAGIGYAALILAIIGLATGPKQELRPYLIMGGIALVLAMGISLHWRGQRVELEAPAAIQELYESMDLGLNSSGLPILLPAAALNRFLPFFSSMRALGRFEVVFILAVAILASYGLAYLRGRNRYLAAGAIALGLGVAFEGAIAPYQYFTPIAVNDRQANEWLAAQPAGTSLVEYPLPLANMNAVYAQSQHGQRVVNGVMQQVPGFFQEALAVLGKWPGDQAIPLLREWQVEYVVVNGAATAEFEQEVLPSIQAIPGLCQVRYFDDGAMFFDRTYIYRVLVPGESCPGP